MARKPLDQLSPAYRARVLRAIKQGKASAEGRISPVSKTGKSLSPAYVKRLERGLVKGKTRQEARGHKPGEARVRRERESAERGITSSQNDIIRRWYRKYNANERQGVPKEDDLIDEAASQGYAWFQNFRKIWEAARRQYLKELKSKEYASRGQQYLNFLTIQARAPDTNWLYYH